MESPRKNLDKKSTSQLQGSTEAVFFFIFQSQNHFSWISVLVVLVDSMCVHLGQKGNIMVIITLIVCFLSFLVFLVCWAKPIYADLEVTENIGTGKYGSFEVKGGLNDRETRDPLRN